MYTYQWRVRESNSYCHNANVAYYRYTNPPPYAVEPMIFTGVVGIEPTSTALKAAILTAELNTYDM